jgi:biotin operon repressor
MSPSPPTPTPTPTPPPPSSTPSALLLTFFKALADANRLKIVGVLAQKDQSVEQLAAAVGLDSSTVSHHLRKLAKAGLVEARSESYYSVYSLRIGEIEAQARKLLGGGALPRLADDADLGAYDRKVLGTFVDEEGRFRAFPVQQKKYLVLVRHALAVFESGVEYSEKEVNERLARFHDDTARLRRSFIDLGYMVRRRDGSGYRRVEGTP